MLNDEVSKIILNKCIGKQIVSIELVSDRLIINFNDGTEIHFWDDDQQCCEMRYMTTDDDLKYYLTSHFIGAEIREVPKNYNYPTKGRSDSNDAHEIQFLVIFTSVGEFTISSHNEHNGYYGGFVISVAETKTINKFNESVDKFNGNIDNFNRNIKEMQDHEDAYIFKSMENETIRDLKEQIDKLQTQLAGCGVAALGGTSESQVANKGDYGWSAAYQDVLNLRICYDQISAAVQKFQYINLITGKYYNEKENQKANK